MTNIEAIIKIYTFLLSSLLFHSLILLIGLKCLKYCKEKNSYYYNLFICSSTSKKALAKTGYSLMTYSLSLTLQLLSIDIKSLSQLSSLPLSYYNILVSYHWDQAKKDYERVYKYQTYSKEIVTSLNPQYYSLLALIKVYLPKLNKYQCRYQIWPSQGLVFVECVKCDNKIRLLNE